MEQFASNHSQCKVNNAANHFDDVNVDGGSRFKNILHEITI